MASAKGTIVVSVSLEIYLVHQDGLKTEAGIFFAAGLRASTYAPVDLRVLLTYLV